MKVDKEIYEVAKKIQNIGVDCDEVNSLIDCFIDMFKYYNNYQKQCIITYILDKLIGEDSFIYNRLASKNLEIRAIGQFISINNEKYYFDFKDVGQYVKHHNNIFEVKERDLSHIIYDGNKIDTDECEVSSIQELRKQKIKKFLKNEKGLD